MIPVASLARVLDHDDDGVALPANHVPLPALVGDLDAPSAFRAAVVVVHPLVAEGADKVLVAVEVPAGASEVSLGVLGAGAQVAVWGLIQARSSVAGGNSHLVAFPVVVIHNAGDAGGLIPVVVSVIPGRSSVQCCEEEPGYCWDKKRKQHGGAGCA
jgi:hypothetical protein